MPTIIKTGVLLYIMCTTQHCFFHLCHSRGPPLSGLKLNKETVEPFSRNGKVMCGGRRPIFCCSISSSNEKLKIGASFPHTSPSLARQQYLL